MKLVAIPFSRGSPRDLPDPRTEPGSPALQADSLPSESPGEPSALVKMKVKSLSRIRIRLFAIPWTVTYQAPPSMGFSRQEYWSGLPFPSPGDLPDPRIKPRSPALPADALTSEPPGKPLAIINMLGHSKLDSLKAKGNCLAYIFTRNAALNGTNSRETFPWPKGIFLQMTT